jgi:hypothetical protein
MKTNKAGSYESLYLSKNPATSVFKKWQQVGPQIYVGAEGIKLSAISRPTFEKATLSTN